MNSNLISFTRMSLSGLALVVVFAGIFQTDGSRNACAQTDIRPLPAPGSQSPPNRFPVPRRTGPQTPRGNSTVKGRVVYKDDSQPLKGARVHVFPANDSSDDSDQGPLNGPPGIIAFTNNGGDFQVDGLAAGKYYVSVGGAGLSSPSGFGIKLPIPMTAIPRREDFEEIIPRHDAQFTVDGTNTAEIEVGILRGGAISGKVLGPSRAPLADLAVHIVSKDGRGGMAQFSTQTDKNGAYRLENVPPGDYVVAASTEDNQGSLDIRARLRGESRIVTYHPAATSARDAMTVRIDSGRETGGVNITLVARSAFSVSGTVVRQQDGTTVAGATVLLRSSDSEPEGILGPGLGQRTTRTDSEGNWSFSNVQEGSYIATALVPSGPSVRPTITRGGPPALESRDREQVFRESRQRFLMAHQNVVLDGSDLKGLSLAIAGPGSIRGSVTTESGAPLPTDLVIFLDIVREGDRPGAPLPVRVQPDGSFSVNEIQGGDIFLNVALIPGAPAFIKSLTVNGADPRGTPLRVIEGAEAGPVQVVISAGLGVVSGRVVSEKNGEGLSGYMVLLAPVQPEKQRFRTAYLATRTSSDGSYSLAAEPGEYFVIARQRDDFPAIMTQEFVNVEGARAQRVVLVSGERKRLDLRIP
jgi:hypothetical protein